MLCEGEYAAAQDTDSSGVTEGHLSNSMRLPLETQKTSHNHFHIYSKIPQQLETHFDVWSQLLS